MGRKEGNLNPKGTLYEEKKTRRMTELNESKLSRIFQRVTGNRKGR